ncbi:MAG: DUF697 domain-containing protein [Planctomycetes bacterium]|nr:DUF697 domain-containing protein [Planctomycetota bacterium]
MATATEEQSETIVEVETKENQANKIVRRNMYYSMGAGVVPMPIFDLVAISGLQMKMLYQFSKLYEVPFPKNIVKSTLASLMGGLGSLPIAAGIAASVTKFIPVIGPLMCLTALPATAGAITYATGKVFIMHFETGGTFLNFNAKEMKEHFGEMYKEGQKEAAKAGK